MNSEKSSEAPEGGLHHWIIGAALAAGILLVKKWKRDEIEEKYGA